jgi:hypothetical protein
MRISLSHVNDSGHWIRQDPAGKHRKSLKNGSSIPVENFSDVFRWIPTNFLCFQEGAGRKALKKI